jgi:hypothetical protein
MTKRQRIDTANGQQAMMAGSLNAPKVPAHVRLRKTDKPFWDAVVRAREYSSWTDNDLVLAGNLARCMADIERLQTEIDAEGDVIVNARGTQIMNPKHSLLETLSRRSVALSRMLQVHAQATQGESREQKKRNQSHRKSLQVVESISNDDLIAKPMH